MSHHRLGHPQEARTWLDRAGRWIEEALGKPDFRIEGRQLDWRQRLELQVLRREAEALIEEKEDIPPK